MTDARLRDKAERALKAAQQALANGDTETAADRAYYAVYYGAWALLDAKGLPRPKPTRDSSPNSPDTSSKKAR